MINKEPLGEEREGEKELSTCGAALHTRIQLALTCGKLTGDQSSSGCQGNSISI